MADFVFAGTLVLSVGVSYELCVNRTKDTAYRAAVGIALAAAFIIVWANGAVGIIGSEDHAANFMYYGVLAVGLIGAFIARFQPPGMALAMITTATAHSLVSVIALVSRLDGPVKILIPNGFFVALFVGSAWLFRAAARRRPEPGAV